MPEFWSGWPPELISKASLVIMRGYVYRKPPNEALVHRRTGDVIDRALLEQLSKDELRARLAERREKLGSRIPRWFGVIFIIWLVRMAEKYSETWLGPDVPRMVVASGAVLVVVHQYRRARSGVG